MLAEKYGADKDVVEVAAIFHDYADLLDFANRDTKDISRSRHGISRRISMPRDGGSSVQERRSNSYARNRTYGARSRILSIWRAATI